MQSAYSARINLTAVSGDSLARAGDELELPTLHVSLRNTRNLACCRGRQLIDGLVLPSSHRPATRLELRSAFTVP